jgi:membrane fusion protein, copper/silver efflux system
MSRGRRSTTAVGVLVLAGLVAAACRQASPPEARAASPAARARYHCPMHPSYASDKAGDCPICGMKLIATEPSASPSTATGPEVAGVPGRAVVSLSPERRRGLGLRTEPVRRSALDRTLRTVGRVTPDERRLHHIHTKYDGYVEHLYVDFTGKLVRKGEPLVSLYSPELVATQQEYLLAWRARLQLAESGLPSVAQGGVDLLEAARRRLLLWDIRPEDITRLEHTGLVQRTLDLHSDVTGYVVQKTALHGMRVTASDTLFDIADLSHLWVLADVYESDLPSVRLGMPAEVSLPYLPGRSWNGIVTNVAPTVEAQTRTIKVRVEVDNADGALKPEMFADVLLRSGRGEGLLLPADAVIHAGERQLVFVDLADGRLQPREVHLGVRVGDAVQVLHGVEEGERVVTTANFLLDSESSLKAALATMSPAPPPEHRH